VAAFDAGAVDYLLKPLAADRLAAAMACAGTADTTPATQRASARDQLLAV
jgi:response regulator of citrate/malate metabolism